MKLRLLEVGLKWQDTEAEFEVDSNDFDRVWNVALADALTRIRRKQRLTQTALAARCGITPQLVYRAERGHTGRNIHFLAVLARGLNCDVSDIIIVAEKTIKDARLREKLERKDVQR